MKTTGQILWGKQPLKNIPWIKLCAFTKSAQKQYEKEGWETTAMGKGEHPARVVSLTTEPTNFAKLH